MKRLARALREFHRGAHSYSLSPTKSALKGLYFYTGLSRPLQHVHTRTATHHERGAEKPRQAETFPAPGSSESVAFAGWPRKLLLAEPLGAAGISFGRESQARVHLSYFILEINTLSLSHSALSRGLLRGISARLLFRARARGERASEPQEAETPRIYKGTPRLWISWLAAFSSSRFHYRERAQIVITRLRRDKSPALQRLYKCFHARISR